MKYIEIKALARKMRNNQTQYEKILWERIKDRKLEGYKFIRQHPLIYDRQGNDLNFFIPDFYCPKARLIIEVDGGIHLEKKNYDQWRDHILSSMQITILHFSNQEILDIERTIERIKIFLVNNRGHKKLE